MYKSLSLISCFCFVSLLHAQVSIQTENNVGAEDLIKDVFIKGNCRNVSNVVAIGNDSLSIGQFSNGSLPIRISDGIILSTGDIALAPGPNISNEAGFSFDSPSSDPDLSQLATGRLFDVTGIEFDFVPFDDRVTFKYVFASEEYCEFVGTNFNDVFGFFVSGPGINGPYDNNAINVATLPGTNDDVSINTVNHLENTSSYISNITTIDAESCELGHDPTYQDMIEYDGFTVPLIASFVVIPCETYRIRLVVGDVGDPILDSAVFLESESFDLGEKTNIRAEVPGSDEPIAYESCVDGQFVFTRGASSNINEDCIIEYTISSDSEAINGVDFEEIPLSVTIPAGEEEFILPITVIEDGVLEGPENLKLEFVYDCDCIDPAGSELIINEASDLTVSFSDIAVCADQPFSISPEIAGGVTPYDFAWNTGATTETIESSIVAPTSYTVTITDFCGTSSTTTANVDLQSVPTASLTGTYDLCETAATGIPVFLEGNPPWTIGYSIDDVEQAPIENIQTSPFFLNTPIDGTYTLTAFSDAYCTGTTVSDAVVEYSTFLVAASVIPPSCFNRSDGSIEITQLEAVAPFSVDWNTATQDDTFLEGLAAGTYTLRIIDADGCLYEESFDLSATSEDIKDCAPVYVPNSFSPNRDGINDVFSVFFAPDSEVENIVSMQVYDRWGSLVFEQLNFNPLNGTIGWRGNHKGKPANPGAYIYSIKVVFSDGSTLQLSGDVTLIR
ncbi:MAG: choice-of-anchor L domain-containing protein [Bacteroidota bacterium]